MAFQGTKIGKTSAQEEEDKRLAEQAKKKAEEEARKKAAEEAAKKKAEEARARKEADALGAQHAEMLSQNSGTKNYTAPKQQNYSVKGGGTTRETLDTTKANNNTAEKKSPGSFFAKPGSTATRNQTNRFGAGTGIRTEERSPGQKISNAGINAMGAGKGIETIDQNKKEKAEKAAFDASFTQEKREMAKIKDTPAPMSDEEILRLLNLDEEETQKQIDELKAQRHDYGGTAQAVVAGRNSKSPATGTAVNFDEERETEIGDLERDLLLHGQLQTTLEHQTILQNPANQAYSRAGWQKWLEDKEAEEPMTKAEAYGKVLGTMGTVGMGSDVLPMVGDVADILGSAYLYANDSSYKEPQNNWTDEQRNIFGYYYYSDPEKAFEYAESVNNALAKEAKGEKLSMWDEIALEHPVLSSAYTVTQTGKGTIDYVDNVIEQLARGTITEKSVPTDFETSQSMRTAITDDLNEKYSLEGTNIGLGTAYSIMMSSLDSMATAYTGGKAGALISAFGSSASAALDDALERGASSEQALGYATLVGAAELLPEYMSVDSLFKLMDAQDAWTIIGNIGKQAGTEGVEGFITAVSDKAVDDVIMGELSSFNVAVNNYMLAGYSREEAEYLARKEINSGIVFDTIAEALGGGFSGAVATGFNTALGGNRNGNASMKDAGTTEQTEVPAPFDGKAEPGTEQGMIADKITEIENRPISEAEKAAKMEEVKNAVAETTGTPEVVAEAERFKEIHEERAAAETQQDSGETAAETQQEGLFGPEIVDKILGFEPAETEMLEAEDIKNNIEEEHQNEEKLESFENQFDRVIIDFNDAEAINNVLSEKEDKMISEGKYVEINDSDIKQLSVYFPDLRTLKKSERNEIIKQKNGEIKEAIKNMLRNVFGAKNIEFEINGNIIEAHLYKQGIDHVLKRLTQRKSAILNKTKEIFEKAEYVYSSFTDEHNDNADIEGWDYFYVPIELPNEISGIKISILNNSRVKDHQIYDWDEKKTPLDGARRPLERGSNEVQRGASSGVSKTIIPSFSEKNNPPSIGNSVFGPEIVDKILGFDTETENDVQDPSDDDFYNKLLGGEDLLHAQDSSTEQTETTPSMKRADGGKNVEDWKSIVERINAENKGIWRMKDFARVLDQVAGNDKGLRQQLYELYEKPLNEAQGSYAKKYAEKAKQITDKFKELGIKAGSKESTAVQRIGEGVKEINKRGETVEYTLDDLKKDFPDSWQQIKEGADFCREVYDEFLHDLNTMYESIYPATVEQARERISSYDNGILRDESKIEHFRGVIKNLEAEKTEKQNQLSKKRPDTLIYAQLQSQIDNIDGRIAKAEKIIGRLQNRELVKRISRETLNSQIENGEILKNKQITPRKDYFRHFQELTNDFAEIAGIFSNDQRIPPNLAGKSADTKPRTIWTSIAQSRAGSNYYTEDAVSGLLRYTEIAEKLLAYDPLISHFRDVNSAIRAASEMVDNEVKGKGTNAGQFAAYADKLTNKIAGKSDTLDRWLSDEWGADGRAIMKTIEVLNSRVKSNAILGNFRSAIVQIGNLPNASLYIQNPIDWVKGAVTLLNGLERDENIRNARAQSNFMNRRYMGDTVDELTKEIQNNNILDKPKEFALWMLGAGDRFGAELIWHTAYTKALNDPTILEGRERGRTYESAVDYADDITRRSVGGRAEGDIPVHMDSKWYSLLAPFQIEVANTFNAAKEAAVDKNWTGLAAFEISIFLMNSLLEGITGDRPLGLDFIQAAVDIWMEATGADDDEEEKEKDFWDIATYAAGRLGGELLSSIPLGAQIASAIAGGDEQKAEDWFGDSDPSRYGTGNIGLGAMADVWSYVSDGETPKKLFELATDGHKNSYEQWSEPVLDTVDTFAPIMLPWGGKQLSRTLQGLDQIYRGGAYGTNADGTEYLKFLQGDELGDFYKTLLFGRYAGSTGQEYITSNFSTSLSEKQTEQMELAENFGVSNKEFVEAINELRGYNTKEEKQQALFNMDISENAKNTIDGILWGGTTWKDENPQSTRDYSSEEAFYTSGLTLKENRLHEMGYSEDDIEAIDKAIKGTGTDSGKIGNISKALDISMGEAYKLYQRMNGEENLSRTGFYNEDYTVNEFIAIERAIKNGQTKADGIEGIEKTLSVDTAKAYEIYQKYNGDWLESADDLSEEDAARAAGANDLYGMSTEDYLSVVNAKGFGGNTKEEILESLMTVNGWDRETAEENYNRVFLYEYSREDISEERAAELDTSQEWYDVDDHGYFVARNAIKTAEGEKDKYGNTISGSEKAAAIKAIAEELGIDEYEAAIYYLAAKGDLELSASDLSSAKQADLEEAMKHGWTERQFLDAVNVVKVSGAKKKADIIAALVAAGATYEMAYGYYNLQENADYYRR